MDKCVLWCTHCGVRFTEAQVEGVNGCPECGATSIPCNPEADYIIEINWHELRILTIWASNWAANFKDDEKGREARESLRGIISRLERQVPKEAPLTLGGEVRQLREAVAHGKIDATKIEAHNIPPEGVVLVSGPGAVGHSTRPPKN